MIISGCVQHCVEFIGVYAQIETDDAKYTALHWGQRAADENVEGARDVVAYLTSRRAEAILEAHFSSR